jgi:hypothetical protein
MAEHHQSVTHRHRLHWYERGLASLTAFSAIVLTVIEIGRSMQWWHG